MNQAAEAVTPSMNNEEMFDINKPEHEELARRYMDAKAVLLVTEAGFEVEDANEAWAIIRTENLMARLMTNAAPKTLQ